MWWNNHKGPLVSSKVSCCLLAGIGAMFINALVLFAVQFLPLSPLAAFLLAFPLGFPFGYALDYAIWGKVPHLYSLWWSLVALGFVLGWDYVLPHFYPVQPLVRSMDPIDAALVGLVLGSAGFVLRGGTSGRELRL